MSSKKQVQVQQKYQRGSAPGARLAPARKALASPSRLKAERVQLKAERVQEALKAMPGWRKTAGGFAIDRVRRYPDPATAADFAVFLMRYAARAGQPVAVELAGEHLAITVPAKGRGGRRGPLDEAVLDFARALG